MSEAGQIQDVNIELGDDLSRMLYEASRLTQQNRPGLLTEFHPSFSGLRAIPASGLAEMGEVYMNLGFDGVGTKVEVSERLGDHAGVAHDLFAMVCDDAVARGAEPVAIGSILDVRQLDDSPETRRAVEQLARGYVEAARAAGVVVVNGEVAELGDRVGGYGNFNYNWGATVLWFAQKDRLLSGHQILPGDTLVGLAEPGFRSNGITDVRRAMLERYGPNWHDVAVDELGGQSLGWLVQQPSIIYTKFITSLIGGYDPAKASLAAVTGVAHITGGGQPSKLGRMLEPSGLGAVIDNPLEPPAIMRHAQAIRGFPDEVAYRKWHMGPGMVIATPEPERVLTLAADRDLQAQAIGKITREPGIRLLNRGSRQDQPWLDFTPR